MISRRKFIKGLFGSVAALTVLPYMPKELTTIQTAHLKPATIKPLGILQVKTSRHVSIGDVVYIDSDGMARPMTFSQFKDDKHPVGIAIDKDTVVISGTIQFDTKTYKPI
jgi:hypothetical protein